MGEEAWQRCGPAEAEPSLWVLQGGNSTPAVPAEPSLWGLQGGNRTPSGGPTRDFHTSLYLGKKL